MKITVLTDLPGKIICASYRASNSNERGLIATQIKPSAEQRVHEIDIPVELCEHILEGTLINEIFKYKVEGIGKGAKLVRESAE